MIEEESEQNAPDVACFVSQAATTLQQLCTEFCRMPFAEVLTPEWDARLEEVERIVRGLCASLVKLVEEVGVARNLA